MKSDVQFSAQINLALISFCSAKVTFAKCEWPYNEAVYGFYRVSLALLRYVIGRLGTFNRDLEILVFATLIPSGSMFQTSVRPACYIRGNLHLNTKPYREVNPIPTLDARTRFRSFPNLLSMIHLTTRESAIHRFIGLSSDLSLMFMPSLVEPHKRPKLCQGSLILRPTSQVFLVLQKILPIRCLHLTVTLVCNFRLPPRWPFNHLRFRSRP